MKCENAMNLFADIRAVVIDSLDALVADGTLPDGLSTTNVSVEPPRDAALHLRADPLSHHDVRRTDNR